MSTAPTVGRIVHYRSYGTPGGEYSPQCRAAIVSEVNDAGEVGLVVFNPLGVFHHPIAHENGPCPQDEARESGGTWHWPCVMAGEAGTV